MSILKQFATGLNKGLTQDYVDAYANSMRAIARNEGKVNIAHKAVHEALLGSVGSYTDLFNEYSTGIKASHGAVTGHLKEVEDAAARKAFDMFTCNLGP